MARLTYHKDGSVSNGPAGKPHLPQAFAAQFRCAVCAKHGKSGTLTVVLSGNGFHIRCSDCSNFATWPRVVHVAVLEHAENVRILKADLEQKRVDLGGEPIFQASEDEYWL